MPFKPVDMKRCVAYPGGIPTLLITNMAYNEIIEVEYPSGNPVWKCGHGARTFNKPWEAEKRPGLGTPTYLITSRGSNLVEIVEQNGPSDGTAIWQLGFAEVQLNDPRDANWTPGGNMLITDTDNKRVIEVDPKTKAIVWEYIHPLYGTSTPFYGTFTPYEATMIENGNILIAGAVGQTPPMDDDNKDGIYPNSFSTGIIEVNKDKSVKWFYQGGDYRFVDVEAKGIINIAKVEYGDMGSKTMKPIFAGVVVPIFQLKRR